MLRKPTLPFFCQFSPTNSTTFEFYVELVSSSVEIVASDNVASDNRYILSACHSVVSEQEIYERVSRFFVCWSVCLFVFCFDFLFLKENNKTRNKQGKESEEKNLEIKAYKF